MDGVKILVIEDDADIREGVRILLESEGFLVDEAENGEIGLRKLSEDISLVILDIMMPGMPGIRVCEEIRKKSFVPILFLTAKAQESDKLLGLMAGGMITFPNRFLMRSSLAESRHRSGAIPFTAIRLVSPRGRKERSISKAAVSGYIRFLMK